MKPSLQVKMVLIMTLLAITLMLVVGTMLVNNVTSFYNDDFLAQVETFFDEDTLDTLSATAHQGAEALSARIALYASQLGIDTYRNYYILDLDGHCLTGSNQTLGQTLEVTPNLLRALAGEVGRESKIAEHYMDYAVPLGDYVIYIKDSKDEVRDLTFEIVFIIIETLFATMILAIALSYLLARTITNPIERLTQGAVRLSEGDFTPISHVGSDDEIGSLTSAFNQMAQTLKNTLSDSEQEKNKFETIFLYLTDGVVVFDEAGLLLNVNRAARELLGGTLTEGETSFAQLITPLTGLQEETLHSQEGTFIQEVTVGERALQMTLAPLELPGEEARPDRARGVIAVLHDVTEQRRLDESRREFIANVSHELRTPLTNIKSYTETVVDAPDLPEENRTAFLEVVLGESDRMIRIVKDLLTLSKLDSAKLEMKPSRFDVAEMVRRVHAAMKIDAYNSKHSLHLEVNDPGTLFGDAVRIEQVLVNIVSNSIKYTPEGGEIRMETHREGENVIMRVSDNGIGIPSEDLERIFDRFYRVDKARSREMGGTGLGLAIAREITRAHHGEITLTSELGKGTTVTITLPAEPPAALLLR
ncbi:MAG: HAMP domain-containing protein [Clostridia bacterium]|nr:HAMP domain-containing protein [Clostridia bacterium]